MAERTSTPPVKITGGHVSGVFDQGSDIAMFRGIPFAEPPVGELRWRPPRPVIPWEGVRSADKPSGIAYQLAHGFEEFMDNFVEGQGWGWLKTTAVKLMLKVAPRPRQSEDCLYLTVRTPSLDTNARLPVMVWIHGGDHQDGSNDQVFYDSNALAGRGVVVVYINYRLGLMGYFAHPELSMESEHGVSGNYGTLDQIAALRWVQDNISAFGGDPDDVTIFGESAGGESVAHMLTSPLARGLFHKAIMQSPANSSQMIFLRRSFGRLPALEEVGRKFAGLFVPNRDDQLPALRRVPAETLYARWRRHEDLHYFFPVIDGHVLEKSPFEAFADGDQMSVPLMLGSNSDEGTLIYPIHEVPLAEYKLEEINPADYQGILGEEFSEDAEELFDIYPGLSGGETRAAMDFVGDEVFGSKVHFYASRAAEKGQPVYLYFFTRVPPSPRQTAGAYHAAELTFVHGSRVPMFPVTPDDEKLTQIMGDYWTQFAKTGTPNSSKLPVWPRFSPEQQQQMRLGVGSELGPERVGRLRQYEILQRRLSRQIEAMKELRQGEAVSLPG